VIGMADVQITEIRERSRALDVGQETDFEIRIRNDGSVDATKLLILATLTDSLAVVNASASGTDERAKLNPDNRGELVFPLIPKLAPDGELFLTIRVKALKADIATCKVSVMYNELNGRRLERAAHTTIMEASRSLR
jgi:uncharacterized repeat protein (TIGR01451 family)